MEVCVKCNYTVCLFHVETTLSRLTEANPGVEYRTEVDLSAADRGDAVQQPPVPSHPPGLLPSQLRHRRLFHGHLPVRVTHVLAVCLSRDQEG